MKKRTSILFIACLILLNACTQSKLISEKATYENDEVYHSRGEKFVTDFDSKKDVGYKSDEEQTESVDEAQPEKDEYFDPSDSNQSDEVNNYYNGNSNGYWNNNGFSQYGYGIGPTWHYSWSPVFGWQWEFGYGVQGGFGCGYNGYWGNNNWGNNYCYNDPWNQWYDPYCGVGCNSWGYGYGYNSNWYCNYYNGFWGSGYYDEFGYGGDTYFGHHSSIYSGSTINSGYTEGTIFDGAKYQRQVLPNNETLVEKPENDLYLNEASSAPTLNNINLIDTEDYFRSNEDSEKIKNDMMNMNPLGISDEFYVSPASPANKETKNEPSQKTGFEFNDNNSRSNSKSVETPSSTNRPSGNSSSTARPSNNSSNSKPRNSKGGGQEASYAPSRSIDAGRNIQSTTGRNSASAGSTRSARR